MSCIKYNFETIWVDFVLTTSDYSLQTIVSKLLALTFQDHVQLEDQQVAPPI